MAEGVQNVIGAMEGVKAGSTWMTIFSIYKNAEDTDKADAALESALASYQSVIDDKKSSDSNKASAYAGMTNAALSSDDTKQAEEYVNKALEADENNVDALCANANYLLASTGSYYQAASYLGSQLEQFDESSEEYNTIYTQFYNYYIYYAIYGK